jgi:hypothetical protein
MRRASVGKRVVTMSITLYQCPGCGRPVEPGEDYVTAREYELEPDFDLHMPERDVAARAERRFHVEHFRGRIGEYVYELVHEETPQ